MENDIKVLSTTEYADGRITVELELNAKGKELLIEAGFNSILRDSLSNFQDEKVEEDVNEDVFKEDPEFVLLYNAIKENNRKASFNEELSRKIMEGEPIGYCGCCGAHAYFEKEIEHDFECIYYEPNPKSNNYE